MQRSEVVVGPHSEENDKFERCKTLKNETASIEDIKKSDEEKWRFISDHPLPLYQGPFSNPIGIKVLGQSFMDFTTFKHSPNQCSDQLRNHILGPFSKQNGSIFYNCQHGNCEVKCRCKICSAPSKCIRNCFSSPCEKCDIQCLSHKILPMRSFSDEHLFTIVAGPGTEKKSLNTIFKKYAGILKCCKFCKDDQLNHEIYHKVYHLRCKFCRHDFRFIENCTNLADLRKRKKALLSKEEDTCSICFKILSSPYHRKKHEESAHSESKYSCKICNQRFQVEKSLQRHMDDIHTNVEMGQRCEQCGVVLSSTATLKRHQDTVHGEESYSCEQCGKKFNRKSNLNRHLEEVHGFERRVNLDFSAAEFILKFKCKECGKRFPRKFSLQRHKETSHNEEKKGFNCSLCRKTFSRKFTLNRHIEICKKKS